MSYVRSFVSEICFVSRSIFVDFQLSIKNKIENSTFFLSLNLTLKNNIIYLKNHVSSF